MRASCSVAVFIENFSLLISHSAA